VRQVALFIMLSAQIGYYQAPAAVSKKRSRDLGIDLGHRERLQHELKRKEVRSVKEADKVGNGWSPVDLAREVG
jgi:hypothetical protein